MTTQNKKHGFDSLPDSFIHIDEMTKTDRYRLALNYALDCFKSQAFHKTHDQLKSEIMDLVSGQAEIVNGCLVYHYQQDLKLKKYTMDKWI